jgi:hypothetical protein
MAQPVRHREKAGKLYPPAVQKMGSAQINLGLYSSLDETRGSGHDASRFEVMEKEGAVRREVLAAIQARLSPEALADLEAMFYLERDRVYSEHYEPYVAQVLREHAVAKDPQAKIMHLLEKTNLLQCLQGAAGKFGRLSLAERLKGL